MTGDNGTGTNDFSYDPLRRLVGETGLAKSYSYQYDLDGNRTRKVQGTTTIDYAYDATDQLKNQTISGVGTAYSYSAYGDLTQSGTSVSTVTTYGYDTASHLISTNGPGGTSDDVSFTLDALGRFGTRSVAGSLDSTYGYIGDGETVVALVAATTRVSAIGPDGSRVATKDASTTAYMLPDLHGNVIGAEASGSTTIVNALRYDGYGQTLGTPYAATGNVAMDVRYQGRLDVSASGEPLYDMSARFYSPAQGVFTQLDSVMGGAQDPLSMNRFLYAEANPATFTDPTGHYISEYDSTAKTRCNSGGDSGCGRTAATSKSTLRAATKRNAGNYHWSGQTAGKNADDRTLPGGQTADNPNSQVDLPPPPLGAKWVKLSTGKWVLTTGTGDGDDCGQAENPFTCSAWANYYSTSIGLCNGKLCWTFPFQQAGQVFDEYMLPGTAAWSALRYQVRWEAAGAATETAAARSLLELPHGFSTESFARFSSTLYSDLKEAGYAETRAVLRGSSATGRNWQTGAPFNSGSDIDLALYGDDVFAAVKKAGVPLRTSPGTRTPELNLDTLQTLGMDGLQRQLTELAGYRVTIMVYRSFEDVAKRSSEYVVIR